MKKVFERHCRPLGFDFAIFQAENKSAQESKSWLFRQHRLSLGLGKEVPGLGGAAGR